MKDLLDKIGALETTQSLIYQALEATPVARGATYHGPTREELRMSLMRALSRKLGIPDDLFQYEESG